MGYYTRFELNFEGPEEAVAKAKEDIENDSYEDIGRYFYESSKWYDYETDMLKFSRKHPEVTFTVFGDGDESDDFWKHVFKDGKHCRVNGKIVYPEITEDDLEEDEFEDDEHDDSDFD